MCARLIPNLPGAGVIPVGPISFNEALVVFSLPLSQVSAGIPPSSIYSLSDSAFTLTLMPVLESNMTIDLLWECFNKQI